jgi:hypothetical protein
MLMIISSFSVHIVTSRSIRDDFHFKQAKRPYPFKMGASSRRPSQIVFISCLSGLSGLEAVIIAPKSRFRGLEFDT